MTTVRSALRLSLGCAFATLILGATASQAQQFTFSTDPVTLEYNTVTGVGSAQIVVRLRENLAGSVPLDADGIFFSLSHDVATLTSSTPLPSGVLIPLNNGEGPDGTACTNSPAGFSCTWVFDLFGQETIQFPTDLEVARFTLNTSPNVWAGNLSGGVETISSIGGAADAVVVDGQPVPASSQFGTIQLVPILSGFVRGDADGDGALVAIPDAITVLSGLFDPGVTLICPLAADANDDGAVDLGDAIFILNYGFVGGAPPPAPFAECGEDPTPDALECGAFSC